MGNFGLREVCSAGEPLNPEVIAQVREAWNLTIRDGFGQTETSVLIANPPGQPVRLGSMGMPMPGVPAVLVDPISGERRDSGEICLALDGDPSIGLAGRPLNLMTGYLDHASDSHGDAMRDGLYRTGDIAGVRRRRLHHLHRALGRRVQVQRLPDQPVRVGVRADRAPRGC